MTDIVKALKYLYPAADPLWHYIIVANEDGTQRINEWRLDTAQPTEQQLADAEAGAIAAEANATPQLTAEEQIAQLQDDNADLREQLEAIKADNLAAMAAIADLNEKVNGGAPA